MWKESDSPVQVLARSGLHSLEDVVPPAGVVAVARLNGAAMMNADRVFEQFSDALLFPSYFGWNWPALSECLRDLSWLSANRFLIVIDNAQDVLLEDVSEREVFFNILVRAGRHWAESYDAENRDSGPRFHAILLSDDQETESLAMTAASRMGRA
ncbi:barstar family protein [Micromonospora sp. RTGN7]|uniref:barstar family protein n=1 Tax=Micromonospora sp. RTGN7 TaxID=3016526 RepID=UPI0029FECDA2|nr:barstar family protein [Micromonospora sp. RTGN7]